MSAVDPVGFLGREFIAYVADVPESVIDAALMDLDHDDHQKVGEAVARCGAFLADSPTGLHHRVAARPEDAAVSAGNQLRQAGGSGLPEVHSDDPLVRPLAEITSDVFPALLLPVIQEPFSPGALVNPPHRFLMNVIEQHPAAGAFATELQGDPLLELFTADPSPPFFSFASGTGSAVQADSLPMALLGSACVRARLMESSFTPETVVHQVEVLVEELRAAQAGDEIPLPVVVALQGFNIQPGSRFDLPWGWLVPADQNALKAVGDAFQARGALFVTKVPGSVTVGSAASSEGPPMPPRSRMRAFETELEVRIQKATLSLLLLDSVPRISAVRTRTVAVTPFFGIGWGASGYGPDPVPGPQGTLTPDQTAELVVTAELVDSRYTPELAIPARRLVSALSTRHDVEDGLVDAVVAWESLFAGTDAGELSFRIAAAMAWLLGSASEARLTLHREIAALYGLRSRILHRGRAGRDVSSERDRAVDLGVATIRALLEEHPDLVPDENRGKKLIMRGEGPVVG